MSLKTKIRGLTAWVNLRLVPQNQLLNNVLMDLLSGTHMKFLIESLTGRDLKRLESMDGLSQQQKQTRIDWALEELKKCGVIPQDTYVDTRLFAMRSADHVFELLWRLISHDIWFIWERAEYLQHDDEEILTQVPFKWTPDPPPPKKKSKKVYKKSFLSGFGSSSVKEVKTEDDEPEADWIKFPDSDFVKNFKKKKREPSEYPSPNNCILEMVNYQLKTTREGKNILCHSLDDLVDSRVLCALVNSFVPNTFTTDLLLNDRWTINTALKTAEKMFYAETPFDSEDLVEGDDQAVSSYFCFFFMVAYKFRQCRAVVHRVDHLNMLIRECNHSLEQFPPILSSISDMQKKKELKEDVENLRQALERLWKRFDTDYCKKWLQHVDSVQIELRNEIRDKIHHRFDTLTVPRNITINDLCLSCVINLSLTNGSGFYLVTSKEPLGEGRKLILRHKETGEYIEDFTSKNKVSVKKILKLPEFESTVDVNPADYPQYEFFFEAPSRNKQLKVGATFLYQVFPGNTVSWQKHFIKSARENEYEIVEKMIIFFKTHPTFINSKEPKTGYTALHWACRMGHFEIVRLLLENGANIDAKSNLKTPPLCSAIEGLQRRVCHLLIEWGCDVHCKSVKGQTPLESIKNGELKKYLMDLYDHYSDIVPKIMGGDMLLLIDALREHSFRTREFCCLRSRCINGSTMLHTAAYYGHVPAVRELLQLRVDINLRDYKGATALHRAKSSEVIEVLVNGGADVDAEDSEGNTPLHVKCYGETNKPSELTSIELLLAKGSCMTKRNSRGLLPIHCCALQGRVDVMRLLMRFDTNKSIIQTLDAEEEKKPPSVIHLAIANDFIDCAHWLLTSGFHFKELEQDILLRRILTEQIKLSKREDGVRFLLDNGADVNPRYPGGNSALHYAASMGGSTDVLELLMTYGAEVDAMNDEGSSPLFFATQSNNQFAACVLIEQGANVRQRNMAGMTAFDYIIDFEEWIECGYFTDEIKARLKAYNLKHARDLIRAITKKVKPIDVQMRRGMSHSAVHFMSNPGSPMVAQYPMSQMSLRSERSLGNRFLPPVRPSPMGYIS